MYTMKVDLLEGGGAWERGLHSQAQEVLVAGLIEFMNSLVSILGHHKHSEV